jgi:hypothetical protein
MVISIKSFLRTCIVASVLVLSTTSVIGVPEQALAASSSTTGVAKATASNMPTIGLNGLLTSQNYTVNSLHDACGQMFAGGHFVTVYSPDHTVSYSRNGLFSFNEATGAVNTTFNPVISGNAVVVDSALPTPDCASVYVSGTFSSVDGNSKAAYLFKYDLINNRLDTSFNSEVNANSEINSLALWNGKLIVGGRFTSIGGLSETGLAALNPATGANTGYFSHIALTGANASSTPEPTFVKTVAVSPTATIDANTGANVQHLLIAGNWTAVGGYGRGQVAMLSLNTAPTVSAWDCTLLHTLADPRFSNFIRGISFMPDGNTFYLAASGGWGPSKLSDSVSRWEMKVSGKLVNPTWVNRTGGDSLWTVAATPAAIYVTGHERWANNPSGQDSAGPGAVARPGIGAISPTTGLAISWNPNRSREVGGEALLVTTAGLWVGSDGAALGCAVPAGVNHDDCTGQTLQSHPGIGFLPY